MATPEQLAELAKVVPAAQTTARLWGVPASVTLAQWMLESAFGTSQLAVRANNFFGIKAVAGEDYAEFPTHEVVRGRTVTELAHFARFGTPQECFATHAHLLATLRRYAQCRRYTDNVVAYVGALYVCGYSTLPTYPAALFGLIRQHKLTQYDKPPSPHYPLTAGKE